MPIPARIGKYEVMDRIGRGGMGVVYKARDSVLGRMVAVKVMTSNASDSNDGRERFLREARAVSMLQHTNIVVVHELGELEGNPYIVMEFLDGQPLDRVIHERTPMTLLQKIEILLQVTKALQYAHEKGIIHRDIKPGNIMILRDGTVKVVDFGMAHLADQTITRTGMLLGTVSFMSPEQLNGEPADARTDIFSVGIVMYLLLTGTPPFEGVSTAETITRILLEQPLPLRQLGTVNQPELQAILDKALAKKKGERYQTCSEMHDALSRLRKRYETQTQLAELEAERRALIAQLGMPEGTAPAVTTQPAGTPPSSVASPPSASSTQDAEMTVAVAPSAVPQAKPPQPAMRAGGSRTTLVVAGIVLLAVAVFLYSRVTRARSPEIPTARNETAVAPPANPTQPASTSLSPPAVPTPPSSSSATEAAPAADKASKNASFTTASARKSTAATVPVTTPTASTPASSVQPVTTLTPEEMNRRGNEALQNKDYAQALSWYRRSAERGFAPGQAGLAFMYQHALGVPKDLAQSQQWYRKAADQGLPRAENELGQACLLGEGHSMDYQQAVEWFRKSAEQGNAFGEHQLGLMYLKGWGGLPQDNAQALQWFRKAADQDLPVGQFSLGNMYLKGWGVQKDYTQALLWFRKAADQGNPRAQQQLGYMYQNGWGVPHDEIQAQYWFEKAKSVPAPR